MFTYFSLSVWLIVWNKLHHIIDFKCTFKEITYVWFLALLLSIALTKVIESNLCIWLENHTNYYSKLALRIRSSKYKTLSMCLDARLASLSRIPMHVPPWFSEATKPSFYIDVVSTVCLVAAVAGPNKHLISNFIIIKSICLPNYTLN